MLRVQEKKFNPNNMPRATRVRYRQSKDGRWYWVLDAANYKSVAIAAGGKRKTYATLEGAKAGYAATKRAFVEAMEVIEYKNKKRG